MERHYSDDTFLARWAAGELSPQELEAFKKSKDYPVFKKINDASLLLETPTYDNQAFMTTQFHGAKPNVSVGRVFMQPLFKLKMAKRRINEPQG